MKMKRLISMILLIGCLVSSFLFTDVHATDNTSWYDARVGQTLANISSSDYNSSNPFSKGQCTWYCFGRALEKCGVYLPAWKSNGTYGNADEWYDNAASAGFSVGYEVRSNSIACYSGMHVIFVEWVDGETVYYTEANKDSNGTYNSGVDCVLVKSTITKLRQRLSSTYQGCIYLEGSGLPAHTIDSSYGTNFTAYPKAKITAENIFNAYHSQISSTSWIGTSDLCTIHEVYTDGCCKVTYPLDNGGTKTVYSKISLFNVASPRVKYWISDTEYGDTPSEYKAGNRYYFCYKFYDAISGKNWDEIEACEYTFNLTFYNPDGSVKYTNQNVFDDDQSWISSFFSEPGTYTAKLVMSGDYTLEGTRTFTVQENPIKVNCSTNSVSLKLGETESQTIYAGYSGYYNGNWVISYNCSNSNVSCTWGEWTDDHRSPLTIKANAIGTTNVTISIKNKDTGSVLDSTTVAVTVGAKSYTVSYSANGGSGAPGSQTKYHNTTLTLSSTKPKKDGYTFLGWSTSATATSATYQPGGSYTANANATLYAVWKLGCENGSHSYSYKATKAPTTSATGMLTGTCSKCKGTTSVTLPKLNTTDYSYVVKTAATCTAVGTGRYTWKTTTYGSFYFDVTIAAKGHSYTNKVTAPTCTAQGYTTHTCSCGYSYKDTYTNATGHSYSYKTTKTPATSATGTLTGTCSKCKGTTTVTLPKLNTTDYSYAVKTAATCTAAGTGRYTWKTTTYGSFYFDVAISAKGHSYSYKATKAPTTSAIGTLTGTCSKCKGTTSVTIPKLNTADYSYVVRTEPTYTSTGVGRYTWKTTTYGSFYFDVTLDKLTASGQIIVHNGVAAPGATVTLTVELKNNPGIAYLAVTPVYDASVLKLVSVENGDIIHDFDHDTNFSWSAAENSTANGVMMRLTFEIADNAAKGDYTVSLKFREAYNYDEQDVGFAVESGLITVSDILYGDANGDGVVNGKDVLLLRKYMANYNYDTGASNVTVSSGGDANGDGKINGKDVLLMRKYMANYNYDTGTSTIVLGPNQ